MGTRVALGKGLASLLPAATVAVDNNNSNKDKIPGITFCNIEEIEANEYQPRQIWHDESLKELAQSISENGIIQPLIVRKTDKGYQLIAGERRLKAAKLSGLTTVPIVIRRSTDKEALELALIENIQRENLNSVDEAYAYYHLIEDFSLTQEEVAKRVGKERATVANYLRLLKLPREAIDALKDDKISFGHAKCLLSLDKVDEQIELLGEVQKNGLSVRQLEKIVSDVKNSKTEETVKEKKKENEVISFVKGLIEKTLMTKVKMMGNENRGKIQIEYYSKDELDRIVSMIKNGA